MHFFSKNNAFFSKKTAFFWDFLEKQIKLRRKKEGDLFHPIGMIGKKKISKFFKDEKIPIFGQQKIWLLCDGDDQVLVRDLLKEHVPIEIQIKITQLFNQEFARRQVVRNGW